MKKSYLNRTAKTILSLLITLAISSELLSQSVLSQTFSYTGSLQQFTVPSCASVMTIEARGAQGGNQGGLGAIMRGVFTLNPAQVLNVIVGQYGGGGGGASGVGSGTVPLIIAGGGGSKFGSSNYPGMNAVTITSGVSGQGQSGLPGGAGGANGSDGGGCIYESANYSTGGRGWNTSMPNGLVGEPSYAYGNYNSSGSYGIGGGGSPAAYTGCHSYSCYPQCCWYSGEAGGGGYSGGGAGNLSSSGGGGGSYNAGTSQNNIGGANTGSGLVIITYTTGPPVLSINASTTHVCLGRMVTLTASGALSYVWTGGIGNGVSFMPSVTGTYSVTGTNPCGSTNSSITISVTPLPLSSVATPTLVCANKPVMLSAVANATSYSWQPGGQNTQNIVVSPSVNTTYTVTASNGTCMGISAVNVSVNPNPAISISASSTLVCPNNSVVLTASSSGSLLWAQGGSTAATVTFNPVAPTLYSVTATNNFGCSTGTVLLIDTKPGPALSVTASSTLVCTGDPVTFTATGNSVSYNWNTGHAVPVITLNPLSSLVYSVTGTFTNNCTATKTIQVDVYTPTITISGNTIVCPGNSTTLSATGADSYSWVGFTGDPLIITPNAPAIYTVNGSVILSNSITCYGSETISVSLYPAPAVSITAPSTVICVDETLILTASGASSYVWNNNQTGGSQTFSSAHANTFSSSITGTDQNGCTSTASINILVNACTVIEEILNDRFKIFPNPSAGEITVISNEPVTLTLYNLTGQAIRTLNLNEGNLYSVTIKDLAGGVYFLKSMKYNFSWKIIVLN